MKKIATSLALVIIFIISSCNQNSPAPSGGGSSNNTNNTNMTAFENSIVGSWKLKRSEPRTYFPGLGDSVGMYTNHYNYSNSLLELTSIASGINGYYDGIFGMIDNQAVYAINWKGGPNNAVTSIQGINFTVKYVSTDSIVVDYGGYRLYYNKNTITPKMNNVELQLLGNPWQLISQNGSAPPTNPTYKIFNNNWGSVLGYFSKDSVININNIPPSVTANYWEVCIPAGLSPFYLMALTIK